MTKIKIIVILIPILFLMRCSDKILIPDESEANKREKIEFTEKLTYLQRHAFASSTRLYYRINSLSELDSAANLFLYNGDFLRSLFADFDFTDSTLIGITFPQVFSSSTFVFIDSLISKNDTLFLYSHMRFKNVYQDITSPSDIVSIKKNEQEFIWKDHFITYE